MGIIVFISTIYSMLLFFFVDLDHANSCQYRNKY